MQKPTNVDAGVLVVEDDVMLALDMESMLVELGFDPIYLAHDIRSGWDCLNSKTVWLAILDVNVRTELVYPLAAEAVARQIPIVFSTGLLPSQMPSEWTIYPILRKPWDLIAFQKALEISGNAIQPQ